MLDIKTTDRVTSEMSCSILNRHSKNTIGVIIDLERCLEYQSMHTKAIRPMLLEWRRMAANSSIEPTKRKQVRDILVSRFHVPELKIMTTRAEDIEALLKDESISEDARHFIELFKKLAKSYQRISALKQFIDANVLDALSFEGKRINSVHPTWNILATGRLSASQPALQNISKDMLDIITYLPNQKLYSADSGQIEPKITYSYYIKDELIKYLIMLYDDAYFGLTHYVLLSETEEAKARANMSAIVKMPITDDLKDKRQRIKKLALSANYGGEEFARGEELGAVFIKKIKNHPLRLRNQEKVHEDIKNGVDTFYTAFGSMIKPEENTKYKRGTLAWNDHLERCGINNPIQGTAADLMNLSVYNANKIIQEKAKSPLTYICGYIHDAGLFYVAEQDEAIADELMECLSYQVTDEDGTKWIPINCDKIIGKRPCK